MQKTKIIAEIGVNHNGSRDLALKMINAAKTAGADAVKIQIFKTEELVTLSADKAEYQKRADTNGETQFEMLKRYELDPGDVAYIKNYCAENEIELMATPFDFQSLELMERLGFETIKISSGDLTNIPLLKRVAATRRDVIISTGMSCLEEIREAMDVFGETHKPALLHCTSNYPTRMEDVHLKAMRTIKDTFQTIVGYSDHTCGIGIAPVAVGLGAEIIEKHFTLDCNLPGPDHTASLEPGMFAGMVQAIRDAEQALGQEIKECQINEFEVRDVARKSIIARSAIRAGEVLTEDNLGLKRPGTGIHPRFYESIMGKRVLFDIEKDQQISWSMVES